MNYNIEEGKEAQWDHVARGLISFNQQQLSTALVPPVKVARVALGEDGEVLGGVLCQYFDVMDNLHVDIIWVDEKSRGKGIGTALLRAAEEFAREHSCILIYLETLDFQAKDFYIKKGYTVFGALEGPPSHKRYFMKKYL